VRIAYTESINRPNYLSLSPFRQRNTTDQRINQGNSNLKNTKARNYDIFLSFYNKIGLFTLGGFYKQIDNIDYIRRSIIVDGDPRLLGWDLIQPENSIGTSEVKGIEIDLQMRFTFLPTPFSGIVLSTNASFIDSKTFYPFSRVERNPTRLIKDTRVGTMVGQPDKIFNFSIGYDLGGFSGRFSVLHQGSYLGVGGAEPSNPGGFRIDVATRSELDAYTAGTTRLDLSLSQRIGDAVKLYFNMNNLSNAIEQEFNGSDYETRREEFGWTAELGIQLQFE
jgi:TonB-dependent receptor